MLDNCVRCDNKVIYPSIREESRGFFFAIICPEHGEVSRRSVYHETRGAAQNALDKYLIRKRVSLQKGDIVQFGYGFGVVQFTDGENVSVRLFTIDKGYRPIVLQQTTTVYRCNLLYRPLPIECKQLCFDYYKRDKTMLSLCEEARQRHKSDVYSEDSNISVIDTLLKGMNKKEKTALSKLLKTM